MTNTLTDPTIPTRTTTMARHWRGGDPFTGYYIIAPILSLMIALYIFYGAFKNMREVYFLLVQRSPATVEVPLIRRRLEGFPGMRLPLYYCQFYYFSPTELA